MSYLNHLAGRALHQLPTVHPRLPTRFEAMPTARVEPENRAPIDYATFTPSPPAAFASAVETRSVAMPPRETPLPSPPTQVADLTPRIAASDSPREINIARREPDSPTEATGQTMARPPLTVIERNTVLESIERAPSAPYVLPIAASTLRTSSR